MKSKKSLICDVLFTLLWFESDYADPDISPDRGMKVSWLAGRFMQLAPGQ